MKFKLLSITLLAVLLISGLCGCSALKSLDAAEDAAEAHIDMVEDALEHAIQSANVPATTQIVPQTPISREEAEKIALDHAGFTAEQVTYLHTEYEIDNGCPQYEVQFHQGKWEYDYEINSETGDIQSFGRDD